MKKITYLFLSVLFSVSLISCSFFTKSENTSIIVNLPAATARAAAPDYISYYEVGAVNRQLGYEKVISTKGTNKSYVEFTELEEGEYNVYVQAFDQDDEIIAGGEDSVTVKNGKQAQAKITLSIPEITLTYYKEDLETVLKTKTVKLTSRAYGLTADDLAEPAANSGYTFGGWYADKNFEAKLENGNGLSTNVSLYPKWDEILVTGITVTGSSTKLYKDQTLTLTATVTPADAKDKTVTWTSSNTSVATVDSEGTVTGVGAGTATITATNEKSGVTGSFEITVPSITIKYSSEGEIKESVTRVLTSETYTLTASDLPSDLVTKADCNFVGWYTDSTFETKYTAGDSVSEDVTLYAYFVAMPVITISYNSNFGNKPEDKVYITNDPYTITAVDLPELSYTGYTFGGWYTDSGYTTPATAGTTVDSNITFYAKWTEILVTNIEIAGSPTVYKGQTVTLTGTVTPTGALDKTLIWTSSATSVATVDEDGKVTGVEAGTATITATNQRSGVSATFEITVPTVTITYNSALATPEPKTYTLTKATYTITADDLPELAYTGYTFEGWYTYSTYTTPVTAGTAISSDVIFYAKWTQNAAGIDATIDNSGEEPFTMSQNGNSVTFTFESEEIAESVIICINGEAAEIENSGATLTVMLEGSIGDTFDVTVVLDSKAYFKIITIEPAGSPTEPGME